MLQVVNNNILKTIFVYLFRASVLTLDQRGSAITLFSICAPVLILFIVGSVEIAEVVMTKHALQWDVDAAALNGAQQLGTDPSSATATRAQTFAANLAAQSTSRWSIQTTATSDATSGSVTVTQAAWRSSFFGSLLPPGGWHLTVSSTAVANAKVPLCVLGLQPSTPSIALNLTSILAAPACLVQSNGNVAVNLGAAVVAKSTRAVGSATGSILAQPVPDSPAVPDPFASLNITVPTACNDNGLTLTNGTQYLNPGVHCGNIIVSGLAVLTLNPGEHYFINGTVALSGLSQIVGSDVVVIFSNNTGISFTDLSSMSLDGRQSGPYAGFVMITDRQYTGTLAISASNARRLHGTVYLPQAALVVSGLNPVADLSPWTVIVANSLQLSGSASLVVNSNYSSSNVPVPTGVGPSGTPHIAN